MASFALPGVFSGIDTDTLVRATMAAERAPLTRLEQQKESWQAKVEALATVEAPLGDLQQLVENLRDVQNLRHVTALSSNWDLLNVQASAGATEGVHEVVVGRLATAAKEIHAGLTPTEAWTHATGVSDPDEVYISADDISGGTGEDYKLVFQFGDEAQVTVDLSSYDATGITLNELVSEINTAAGYTAAAAVLDGSQYKLRIQAQNAGEDHALTITDDDSVAALDSTDDFAQTVDGDVGTDALVGAGQFVYTYNGVTRTVTTTAGTKLGQLRDLVNNDGGNPGVRASVLSYQGQTGGKYHLVLTGQDTGADYTITVEATTTLGGFEAANWTQTQAAQDSRIRVDGYPPGGWIETAGNVVTEAIPGVTLNLLGTTAAGAAMVAESSNTSVLTVEASDDASPGRYEIEVNQLARTERQAHTAGMISTNSLVGAGQFVYVYDGVTRTVTTDASTSLAAFRDLINDDASNPGVTASVLQYGGMYHLVLDGQDTGQDYSITITGATTLTDFEAADFTETSAQDAEIKVNGYPPGAGDWISRSTNAITDAVPGATITLQGTGTATVNVKVPDDDVGSVTVTVSRNTNQLKTDLRNLVAIYNAIASKFQDVAGYDMETQTAGPLLGDAGVNEMLARVRSLLTSTPPGFDGEEDTYSLAVQIGIEIDRNGLLELDEDALDAAIAEDYDAVLALVGAAGVGLTDTSFVQFNGADDSTTAGIYEVEIDFDAAGSVTAARFRTQGETEWRDGTVDGNIVMGASGNPEQWLELTAIADPAHSGSPYTQSAVVRLQQGIAGALYEELEDILDTTSGPIAAKRDRYRDAMENLDDRIEAQEDLLTLKEERLRQRYARLEETLAELDSFRAAFDSLFSSLEAMSNAVSQTNQ
jgi:flagellar hook-associated protein 2